MVVSPKIVPSKCIITGALQTPTSLLGSRAKICNIDTAANGDKFENFEKNKNFVRINEKSLVAWPNFALITRVLFFFFFLKETRTIFVLVITLSDKNFFSNGVYFRLGSIGKKF